MYWLSLFQHDVGLDGVVRTLRFCGCSVIVGQCVYVLDRMRGSPLYYLEHYNDTYCLHLTSGAFYLHAYDEQNGWRDKVHPGHGCSAVVSAIASSSL